MSEPVLEMSNIFKSYGGIEVLHNVDFTLETGQVHGLVGQNGAGKSTLMKILSGVVARSSGTIKIASQQVNYHSPLEARKYGIGMIFQEFSLVQSLNITQNVFLTKELRKSPIFLDDKECEKRTITLLKELGIEDLNPKQLVQNLSIGSKQVVEIAKALSGTLKILVMDEPTASLSHYEIDLLFAMIARLRQKGMSIVYVSHYLKDVFKICDSITVLRDGAKIFTKDIEKTTLGEVVSNMLGKNLINRAKRKKKEIDRNTLPLLEVKDLEIGSLVKDVSFKLWPNEILGIAGLLGSGRSEVVSAIYGSIKKHNGEIYLKGKNLRIRGPYDAISSGITIVPEDRRIQGLIMDFSIKENLIFPILKKEKLSFYINESKIVNIVKEYMQKFNIKASGFWQVVKFLSGGNQQKVVVSKSILGQSQVLLLDDPTFGVDIQSKQDIMEIVSEFADSGKGVIFISSELDEMVHFCDRILILRKGAIIETIDCQQRQDVSEEMLLKSIQ
jgi:ribose transport system ATP-binding protein